MKIVVSKKNLIVISLIFLSAELAMADNKPPWEVLDSSKEKKDCIDCVADLNFSNKTPRKIIKDKQKELNSYNNSGYSYVIKSSDIVTRPIKPLEFKDKIYLEQKTKPTRVKSVSIQLGAFRRYSGAKKYLKKYGILSSKYKVTIKAGAKDQKPIYRVRIEGFTSRSKAKEFKLKYGLAGAFLVMK